MRIVIVDDSDLLRDRIKSRLNEIENIEIIGEANNGSEALQIINDTNPDFIILDIRMPDLSGISILKKIKEQGLKCKICILTSYSYTQYKETCITEGADYFFDKNQDLLLMIHTIDRLAK